MILSRLDMRSLGMKEIAERPVVAGGWSLAAGWNSSPFVIYIHSLVYLCGNFCQENFLTCDRDRAAFRFHSPAWTEENPGPTLPPSLLDIELFLHSIRA